MAVYTLGRWRTRPGHEDEFVAAWQAMASATKADFRHASAVLLRDRDDPAVFISVGPWDSLEQVDDWRASPAFRDGVDGIRPHLEGFEPHTMDLVVAVD